MVSLQLRIQHGWGRLNVRQLSGTTSTMIFHIDNQGVAHGPLVHWCYMMLIIRGDQGWSRRKSQRDSKSRPTQLVIAILLGVQMWRCVHLGLSWNHVHNDLHTSRITRHLHVQRTTSCSSRARTVSPVMNNPLVCFTSGGSNSKATCDSRMDKAKHVQSPSLFQTKEII